MTECPNCARLAVAAVELLEVAGLRGDNDLPHPCNEAKLWTARMQEAWDELQAASDAALTTEPATDAGEVLSCYRCSAARTDMVPCPRCGSRPPAQQAPIECSVCGYYRAPAAVCGKCGDPPAQQAPDAGLVKAVVKAAREWAATRAISEACTCANDEPCPHIGPYADAEAVLLRALDQRGTGDGDG